MSELWVTLAFRSQGDEEKRQPANQEKTKQKWDPGIHMEKVYQEEGNVLNAATE